MNRHFYSSRPLRDLSNSFSCQSLWTSAYGPLSAPTDFIALRRRTPAQIGHVRGPRNSHPLRSRRGWHVPSFASRVISPPCSPPQAPPSAPRPDPKWRSPYYAPRDDSALAVGAFGNLCLREALEGALGLGGILQTADAAWSCVDVQ